MYHHLYRVHFYGATARKNHAFRIVPMTMGMRDATHTSRDYSLNPYAQAGDLVKAHAKEVMSIFGDDIEVTACYLAAERGKHSDVYYYLATGTHKEA